MQVENVLMKTVEKNIFLQNIFKIFWTGIEAV